MPTRSRQILECNLSPCLRYRYLLRVSLCPDQPTSQTLTLILKNPSTADATRGDPTTGKVEAWARQHGYGIVTYLNLFALRSPHPKVLNTVSFQDAIGAENDRILQSELAAAQTIIIAWGNPNGIDPIRYQQRIAEVNRLLSHSQKSIHTVGKYTLLGYPRHGLQWRKEMEIGRLSD